MLFRHSMIIFPHLLSRPRTAMSISLPATEGFIFRRTKAKQIRSLMVRELCIVQCMSLLMKLIWAIAELCYLLRYPARHGRKSGCPFSIRQMAIYQRFDHVKKDPDGSS